ncbi:MAG: hypothetical protein FWD38_08025 [Oscillospiraceae bacterium]|nr:hypothetical protein [Oscillospiraceae bacterium]
MADKKNENKIMAMLERTGVIRKADSADGDDFGTQNGSDIKPIFDVPENTVKAARQPIPGMPTPVFPSESTSDPAPEQAAPAADEFPEFDISDDVAASDYETNTYDEPTPVSYEETLPAAPLAPPIAPAAPPYTPPAYAPAAPEREPTPENYTDRFLNTEELYDALALRSKKTDTIYLIEEYLQTLPDSLPDTSRRDIVNKLLSASGFDYDLLMGDGVLRVKMLKEYAERFARHTDDYIAARQAELDELDRQILRTQRLIANRKDLHKKQFFSIEAEAQRLKEILTFISG